MRGRHFFVNVDARAEDTSDRENCNPHQTGCHHIERLENDFPEMDVPGAALPGPDHWMLEDQSFHYRAPLFIDRWVSPRIGVAASS